MLEMSERALAFLLLRGGEELGTIQVRCEEVDMAARVIVRFAPPVAGRADCRARIAVVATVGGEDLVAPGDQTCRAHGVLVRVGAGVCKEHLVEPLRCAACNKRGCPSAGEVRVVGADGGEQFGLLLDAFDDRGVLVADIHVDLLAGEVQHLTAIRVVEPHAVAGDHLGWVEVALRVPGVENVRAVQRVGVVPDRLICRAIVSHDVSFPRMGSGIGPAVFIWHRM